MRFTDDFSGIPFQVSEYVPKGEVWLIQEGKKATIRAHEGPHAGEDVTVWLQRQSAVKIFNLGEIPDPKIEFSIEPLGTWAGRGSPKGGRDNDAR